MLSKIKEWLHIDSKPSINKEIQNALIEMDLCREDNIERYKELANVVLTLENARSAKRESSISPRTIFGGLVGTILPTLSIIFAEELRPLPSKAWGFVRTTFK